MVGILVALVALVTSILPVQADTSSDCARGSDIDVRIRACSALIETNPRDFRAYSFRGYGYEMKGQTERAIADYTRAIEIKSDYADAVLNRATLFRKKGEFNRAIAEYNRIIAASRINSNVLSDHGRLVAYNNRGIAYHLQADYDGAIADFTQALAIDTIKTEHRAAALSLRGAAHVQKGEFDQAIQDYTRALELDPSSADTRSRLQQALAARDEANGMAATPVHGPPARPADFGRRVALVIGNSGYLSAPALINPRHDAETVADVLRHVGFQNVTLKHDLNRAGLVEALREFARQADAADWAIVYYAGHGVEMNGSNFLIPVDAKLETDRDLIFEAVPLEQAMSSAEGAKRMRLVLLDACRDNPFARQMRRTAATRSIGRGLAPIEPGAGMLLVYAAKHGDIALDGTGRNSPFVTAFVRQIVRPGVEIRKLFDLVRDDVMEMTNNRQQPFTYGSVPGRDDFFFTAAR
jgi:tetratricopeptide (TPR) repeat protein